VVVLLLKSSECSCYVGLLIWHEECFLRSKLDFILVFLRNFPLVLERDSRFVLHSDALFARYPLEDRREE
jgi:hypothetical protein